MKTWVDGKKKLLRNKNKFLIRSDSSLKKTKRYISIYIFIQE